MINVIIPEFMFFEEHANCVLRIFDQEREKFYDDVKIVGVYGSYDTILDGDSLFYHPVDAARIKAFSEKMKEHNVKMYFTYNNPYLDEKMVKDSVGRQYLNLTNSCGNKVIIANSNLEEELLSRGYPEEDIIYDMKKIGNNDFLEKLSSKNCVILNENDNKNLKLLASLSNPKNVIIKNSSQCLDSCPYYSDCLNNLVEYRFKMCEGVKLCRYNALDDNYYRTAKVRKNFISHDVFAKEYLPLGIDTVLIGDIKTTMLNKIESIVDFVVKPEHRDDVRFEIMHKESVTDTLSRRKTNGKEN